MKHRSIKKEKGTVAVIFLGAIFSSVTLAILSFILAFIAGATEDPMKLLGIMSTLALLLTAAVSGFAITVYKRDGGFLTCVLSSTLFVLLLIGAALIMSGGSIPPKNLLNYLCYFAVSTLISLFASKQRGKRMF